MSEVDHLNTTVILVAYHGDRWLPNCLNSLSLASSRSLHLVLVDNSGNSYIDTVSLSSFRAEVIRTTRPMGFAEANNYALLRASHIEDTVLFLNQDTISSEGWLSNCVECLQSNPDVVAVTPLIATYDWEGWDPHFLESARKSDLFRKDFDAGVPLNVLYEVPVIPAAAMVIRSDLLKAIGPFDPIFGSYYEDYDLCQRIHDSGCKVGICTRGKIAHYSGSATITKASEDKRARWITRNRVIYQLRGVSRRRSVAFLKYLAVDFPRNLARSLLRRPSAKPLLPFLLGNWDLLCLLPRLVSRGYDRNQWKKYLKSIGWPPSV